MMYFISVHWIILTQTLSYSPFMSEPCESNIVPGFPLVTRITEIPHHVEFQPQLCEESTVHNQNMI